MGNIGSIRKLHQLWEKPMLGFGMNAIPTNLMVDCHIYMKERIFPVACAPSLDEMNAIIHKYQVVYVCMCVCL